jgi:chromosome partitioning protein
MDDLLSNKKHPSSLNQTPRVITVANQKGGVGKTTTVVNVATCLAEMGNKVLIVDFDPQANATSAVGIEPGSFTDSIYEVILGHSSMSDCIIKTNWQGLSIAPATIDLSGAEIELVSAFNRERYLKTAITNVIDEYDYVFIDCPPSIGLLTVNALTAADEVLVPIQCEYLALEGLGQLINNVEKVKTHLNDDLHISMIALVMFDGRTKLASQVVQEVRDHFGEKVCNQVIPRSVRLSEAPSYGQPIIYYDSKSRAAIAYRALAKEISSGT